MAEDNTDSNKKDISRLRSEVRKLQETKKDVSAFSGLSTGNYWTATGMPWVGPDGRKAVLTEYFWQPIRGQPRRVDTNELRQFSQSFWVSACVKTLMDEISSLDWDIIPKDEYKYDWVEKQIKEVKHFLQNPNQNNESFGDIIRALLKDILEIDAGVIVKVFDIESYDFNNIEPLSGAPILKPKGERNMTEIYIRDGASFLKEVDKFGFEQGYWQYSYQIPAHPMWFNKDEIVYIIEHSRSMSCYGFARTQSTLDIVKSLHYSTLYNKRFFEESPIPDGALSLLDTNEVEMKSFMGYWNNEFKAQPHKVAIMNKDIKWTPFAVSQRELEFLDTQKWYFNIIISSFGLTPSELGITDDLNRATSATQAELVKRKGIRPFLKLLEANINKGVLEEFDYEGIEFQFVYDDPAEKSARLSNWTNELSMGVKTINEVRNEMGLEPIEGGDISNNMRDMYGGNPNDYSNSNNNNNNQNDGNTKQEQDQSQGYGDTVSREEGEGEKKKTKKEAPDPKQLEMGIKIEREHQDSLNLTDEQVEQVARDHLKEFPDYYTHLIAMEDKLKADAKKGFDDGQYYRPTPHSQPRRPSGADSQPQMNVQNPDYPNLVAREPNMIDCPICGRPTLTHFHAEENIPDDMRCTQCGARFRSEDLKNGPMMEAMTNLLQANNNSTPVKYDKMFNKSLDEMMDVKSYCGFDTAKSFPFVEMFADSDQYKMLLSKFLKDLSKKQIDSVIKILKEALVGSDSIYNVTQKINEVIDDYPRAQNIARTEIIRLANQGNLYRIKAKGTSMVKFISAPEDGRLCKLCKAKDDKIFSIKQAEGMIPIHPRCRCTFTEYEKP